MAEYIERETLEQFAMNCVGGMVDMMQIHSFPAADVLPAKWISVEDRLPEKDDVVLTCAYGSDVIVQKDGETLAEAITRVAKIPHVYAGFIDDEGFWNGIDGYPMIIQPSYWMPLPEPPKAEEAEND